ncbi:hypothetical protein [Vagococcus sp.]|uniref:hypothetical protein n=1 Tax=Vagococcus sp. TaxID=1933889 RepID=UPI002FCA666A
MKKLISLSLVGICTLLLVACGSTTGSDAKQNEQSKSSSSIETNYSNEDLKVIFTSLSDSFVAMQRSMIADDSVKINESAEKALELSKKTKKELKKEKSEVAKDLSKYATLINDLAIAVKNSDVEVISNSGQKIGEQVGLLSRNHFGDYIPESITNMMNENKKSNEIAEKEKKKTTFGLGEWWEVENGWKLKINSVTPTNERNQFSDKTPAQVVVINYTYENLGYEGTVQDLFMTPSNVIDSGKLMAETYPSGASTSPKPTPIGAIMEGAESAYGLQTEGGEITVTFSQRDNFSEKHTASFVVPVSN